MKHILITGAAGNLGRTVTRRFLENGHRVSAIVSKSKDPGFREQSLLHIYHADLLQEKETATVISKAAEAGSGIDMGILLAGGFASGRIQETSVNDIAEMYRLNFVTAYNSARPLFRLMEKQESGGQIILMGARPAIEPGSAHRMVAYTLSKSLLFKLFELINEEGKNKGVTSSMIVPSTIDTPPNREAMPDADFSNWVTSGQIADNLLHLVSPSGLQLRGTILKIYGNA